MNIHRNTLIGVFFTLFSAFCYAVLNAFVKLNNNHMSVPMMVFGQNFVSLIITSSIILIKNHKGFSQLLSSQKIPLHFLRALFSLAVSYLLFFSLKYIPLVDAVLLSNLSPLVLPLLLYIFSHKKIKMLSYVSIITGFVGVIMILKPGVEKFDTGVILAVSSSICVAFSMLIAKILAATEKWVVSVFYYFFFSVVLSGILLPFFLQAISLADLEVLLLLGTLFFLVQINLVIALYYTDSQIVSTGYYSCIVFSSLLNLFIWKTSIDGLTLIGIFLISTGGILCIKVNARNS